jgi:hypothetical protein
MTSQVQVSRGNEPDWGDVTDPHASDDDWQWCTDCDGTGTLHRTAADPDDCLLCRGVGFLIA